MLSDDGHGGDENQEVCTISNGAFKWSQGEKDVLTGVNVTVGKGSLTAIVGKVGSGKSSVLNAILGEMVVSAGRVSVARRSSLAYVSQQAWIRNATVKDNITFGKRSDDDDDKFYHEAGFLFGHFFE